MPIEKLSGFRKKRSCISAITDVVKDIQSRIDKNWVTLLTLLVTLRVTGITRSFLIFSKILKNVGASVMGKNLHSKFQIFSFYNFRDRTWLDRLY